MMWNSEIAVENNNCLAVSDAECALTSDSISTRGTMSTLGTMVSTVGGRCYVCQGLSVCVSVCSVCVVSVHPWVGEGCLISFV